MEEDRIPRQIVAKMLIRENKTIMNVTITSIFVTFIALILSINMIYLSVGIAGLACTYYGYLATKSKKNIDYLKQKYSSNKTDLPPPSLWPPGVR